MTIADAYAIQNAWVARKVATGNGVRGHKIGLTSKAMQSALGSTSRIPASSSTTCSSPMEARSRASASSPPVSRPSSLSS